MPLDFDLDDCASDGEQYVVSCEQFGMTCMDDATMMDSGHAVMMLRILYLNLMQFWKQWMYVASEQLGTQIHAVWTWFWTLRQMGLFFLWSLEL